MPHSPAKRTSLLNNLPSHELQLFHHLLGFLLQIAPEISLAESQFQNSHCMRSQDGDLDSGTGETSMLVVLCCEPKPAIIEMVLRQMRCKYVRESTNMQDTHRHIWYTNTSTQR